MILQLKSSFRALHRSPGFTFTAVLVLGLGLGANTVLFNVVHALLWRPLPFPDSGRLVALRDRTPRGVVTDSVSGRDLADLRRVEAIAEIGATEGANPVTVVRGNDTVDLESAGVNSGYLRALGLRPIVGRLFGEEEDLGQAQERRVILMESAWRAYFGADPSIAGRLIESIDGDQRKPMRVVGVVSDRETLPYLSSVKLLTPVAWLAADVRQDRGNALYVTVIRLKPGVGLENASAQVASAFRNSERELPADQRGRTCWLEPLRNVFVASSRTPVWLLYAAAGLLLLLTVTNVAGLFLSHSMRRTHETAVRAALGATLGHTLCSFLFEALLVCGGGLVLALTLNAWVVAFVPRFVPEIAELGPSLLDPGFALVAFGCGLCLLVAGALSVLPTLQARRASLVGSLTPSTRVAGGGSSWRTMLVGAQLAILLVLLAVGGLIGRSFVQALRTDPGFDPQHVVTFSAGLPVPANARAAAAYDLVGVISSIPGTVRVGFSNERPIGLVYAATHSAREGAFTGQDPGVPFRMVDGEYLHALGARFVGGRSFTRTEVERGQNVAVINRAAVRLLFGDVNPIGRTIHSALGNRRLTVVGIVRDMRTNGLDLKAPAMVYMPYAPLFMRDVVFSARVGGDVGAWEAALRARVRAWNANAVVRTVTPLAGDLKDTVQGRFRAAALIGLFALLGLIVGSVGLYAAMAGNVQRMVREIGVRIVLGASSRSVLLQVMKQGGRVLALGSIAGLAGALAAARLIRGELYGVGAFDAASFALALGVLGAAALVAMLLPALRATRIDPAEALRTE